MRDCIVLFSVLMIDIEVWRWAVFEFSGLGFLGGSGLRWGWLVIGSCLFCRCVYSFVGYFKFRREREAELGVRVIAFINIYVKNFSGYVDERGL